MNLLEESRCVESGAVVFLWLSVTRVHTLKVNLAFLILGVCTLLLLPKLKARSVCPDALVQMLMRNVRNVRCV